MCSQQVSERENKRKKKQNKRAIFFFFFVSASLRRVAVLKTSAQSVTSTSEHLPGGRRSVRGRDLRTKSDKKATVPCRFPPPRRSAFSVHRAGGRQGASGSVAIQLWERLVASRHSLFPLCAAAMAKRLFTVAFYVVLINFFSSSALFQVFLQLRFTCSAPQNRFSSKIAIKSLWKFMSIVAAICQERKRRKNK